MSKEPNKSDENVDESTEFDVIAAYKEIISMMEPKETIAKSLRRLGGNKRLTTAERWKLKKAGLSTDGGSSSKVTRLTELANQILTANGNMDVYQETYEHISQIVRIFLILIYKLNYEFVFFIRLILFRSIYNWNYLTS